MKKKMIIFGIIAALILISIIVVHQLDYSKYTKDEIKFYNEFKNSGIKKDNNVKYIAYNQIKKGEKIVYITSSNKKSNDFLLPLIDSKILEYNTTLYYYHGAKNNELDSLDINSKYPAVIFIKDGEISYKMVADKKTKDLGNKRISKILDDEIEKVVSAGVCQKDSKC